MDLLAQRKRLAACAILAQKLQLCKPVGGKGGIPAGQLLCEEVAMASDSKETCDLRGQPT